MAVPMSNAEITPSKSNIFLRLWRGELPLWQSYWIYGALGGLVLRFISPAITYFLVANSKSLSLFDIRAITYIWFAAVTFYTVVVLVGIWRSADNYRALHDGKTGYATLAKIGVVLGGLSLLGALAQFASNDDQISTLSKGTTPDEQMQYQAVISGLNADLPKMVDSITRLNKIDIQNGSFVYYETILKQFDDKAAALARIKLTIAAGLCKDADTVKSLNSGANYIYIYSDSKGLPIGQLTISKSDCAS